MQIIKVEQYIFECATDTEVYRAQSLLTKEEGTIAWLRRTVRPGDVVYDIGANIGLYSVVAGYLLQVGAGDGCPVDTCSVTMKPCPEHGGVALYAFEPHLANAGRLIRNLRVNKLSGQCRVLSVALHDKTGFLPFHYTSNESGSSGSQVGEALDEYGKPFEPVSVEIKFATAVDDLHMDAVIRPATVIKIDVDGHEPQILAGMFYMLKQPTLRSVQVEMHPATDAAIVAQMQEAGFAVVERHYTSAGKQALAKGADPMAVAHNAVFERV